MFGFLLAGTIIQGTTGVPLPGNVIGLALFTAALFLKLIKLEWVEDSAQLLLKNMMLFFVPIIVATIAFWPDILRNGLPIVLTLVFSSLVTLAVTGLVTQGRAGKDQVPGEVERSEATKGDAGAR